MLNNTRRQSSAVLSSIAGAISNWSYRYLPVLFVLAAALAFPAGSRAVEMQIEGLQDSLAGPPAINHCTLRKAINNANDNAATYPQCQPGEPGNDTIVFSLPGTITFALAGSGEDAGETGDLDITDSLTIMGHPDGTVIDAADLDRIFHVITPGITVVLINIHIKNGTGLGGGGAIWINNGAAVILYGCTVSGSLADEGDGGGILIDGGNLNATNSTISGNIADFHAGAVVVNSGSASFTNCTVTGNSSMTGLTGGIRNTGETTLRSTIITGNTNLSMVGFIPNLDGVFISLGYNVIGELGEQVGNPTIVPDPGTADQLDVSDAAVNLGALADNGGPTPTHGLRLGSIAIDQGHSSGFLADQREELRPCDDSAIANATGGDGSDSGAFEVQTACSGNSAPDAIDDLATVAEDSGANAINVLANDTDPNADPLTVSSVTQGTNGSVAITGGGSGISYTPNPDFFGNDSFTYTVSDGNGGMDTAAVTVTVTNVADPPNANDDGTTVSEDSSGNVVNVLANDSDPDSDALTVSAVTQGASGTVTNNSNAVSYTPNPNFFGNDSFTYTISDGNGGFDTATVNVTVTNVNDTPVAQNDNYSVNQGATLSVSAPGVLGNDADVDGNPLSAVLVSNVSHGTLALNPDGSFSYQPNAAFTGTDTFTYTASDGFGNSNVATVTMAVVDAEGPQIKASILWQWLWPPTHHLVKVGLRVTATDNGGGPVRIQVLVFSDEDDLSSGGREHSPDAKNIAPRMLRLRAERDGHGDGRVYLIVIVATDSSNNVSRKALTVVVPHSLSRASTNSVKQQAAAALAHFLATGNPPPGYFVVGDGPTVGHKQ